MQDIAQRKTNKHVLATVRPNTTTACQSKAASNACIRSFLARIHVVLALHRLVNRFVSQSTISVFPCSALSNAGTFEANARKIAMTNVIYPTMDVQTTVSESTTTVCLFSTHPSAGYGAINASTSALLSTAQPASQIVSASITTAPLSLANQDALDTEINVHLNAIRIMVLVSHNCA